MRSSSRAGLRHQVPLSSSISSSRTSAVTREQFSSDGNFWVGLALTTTTISSVFFKHSVSASGMSHLCLCIVAARIRSVCVCLSAACMHAGGVHMRVCLTIVCLFLSVLLSVCLSACPPDPHYLLTYLRKCLSSCQLARLPAYVHASAYMPACIDGWMGGWISEGRNFFFLWRNATEQIIRTCSKDPRPPPPPPKKSKNKINT